MAEKSRFWAFVEHPRTALVGALIVTALGLASPGIASYVLFSLAGVLVIRSAWEWQPIRSHIPFRFQSPVVLLGTRPSKPAAPGYDDPINSDMDPEEALKLVMEPEPEGQEDEVSPE